MKRRTNPLFAILATVAVASLLLTSVAESASLDSNFGHNGTVITQTGNPPYSPSLTDNFTGNVWAIAEDRQGRLLAGSGTAQESLLIRYMPDGSIDESFGDGGRVSFSPVLSPDDPERTSTRIRAISLLPAGKILLAVEETRIDREFLNPPEKYFVRLLPNGTADSTFANFPNYFDGPPPLVVLGGSQHVRDLAVQRDGKILTSGYYPNSVNSKNRDFGYITRQFGELPPGGGSLAFDPNFARGTFLGAGSVEIFPRKWPFKNSFSEIELLGSGKILVAGNLRNRFFVGRLTKWGQWDRTFGGFHNGKVVSEIRNDKGRDCLCSVGFGMDRDRKGRIVQVGWSFPDGTQRTMNLFRYRPNGRPDRSFGWRGRVKLKLNQYVTVRRVVVHPSGKIFVAAWLGEQTSEKFAVFAFRPDGRPLRSFFHKGRYISPIGEISTAEDILIDRCGRLVVSGGTFKNGDASFVIKRFRVGR
jgi:uncharacterized delta-60 repeat protein